MSRMNREGLMAEFNGRVKLVKELGFPIAICMIFLTGFGVIGRWMMCNQDQLIESTVTTNNLLAASLEKSVVALNKIELSLQAQSAMLDARTVLFDKLSAAESTTEGLVRENGETMKALLAEMQSANKMMGSAPSRGEKTIALLEAMVEELKGLRKNAQPAGSTTPPSG